MVRKMGLRSRKVEVAGVCDYVSVAFGTFYC